MEGTSSLNTLIWGLYRGHHLCRTCLLLLLTCALGGAWTLEQPGNSCLEFHPAFTYVTTQMISVCGSIGAVPFMQYSSYVCSSEPAISQPQPGLEYLRFPVYPGGCIITTQRQLNGNTLLPTALPSEPWIRASFRFMGKS